MAEIASRITEKPQWKSLKPQEKVFVTELIRTGRPTDAARATHPYAPGKSSARARACNLRKNPRVVEALKCIFDESLITVEYVLKGFYELSQHPDPSIRIKSYEAMAKYLKMYADGTTNVFLKIDI